MRIDLSRVLSQYFSYAYPELCLMRRDESASQINAIARRRSMQRLIAGDQQFDGDQYDDDDFEPQRPPGVDDVGEHFGGIGDDRELARERLGAFLQLILVFEPRVEPV